MPIARCVYAALILGFTTAAQAQTAPAPGQEPPPKAEAGTSAQYNCIAEKENYNREGKRITYRIELTNKCEERLRCRVYVYVVGAMGPAQGHATMILEGKSRGAAATKVYDLKVKLAGGLGQVARACRVF